jgi:AcrR family transcriptional regulator
MKVTRRRQAERSASTRSALIVAARPLFAQHGFARVGTETIVRAAGVTRGALYHQFPDKTELFAAVFEALNEELVTRVGAGVTGAEPIDAVAALRAGAATWLEVCGDPEVHRIVLVEGPAVLGWTRWREIGMRHGLGLVTGVLEHALVTGQIAPQPIDLLAHMLIGALDEAALYVADAADPAAARVDALAMIGRFIGSATAR